MSEQIHPKLILGTRYFNPIFNLILIYDGVDEDESVFRHKFLRNTIKNADGKIIHKCSPVYLSDFETLYMDIYTETPKQVLLD